MPLAMNPLTARSFEIEPQSSWVPMVVVAMAQALLSFNVASLPISMGGMVDSFRTPPTTVGTAIVVYSLVVSGFSMPGAKLCQRFGAKLYLQSSLSVFLVAMMIMAVSPTVRVMLAAQALAGVSAAALGPTLVVLITSHYRGKQQSRALGLLGSAGAMAAVLAFLVIGALERFVSWRAAFGLLAVLSVAILFASSKLQPCKARPEVKMDVMGAILAATAIILITLGFNNVRTWGLLLARPAAPYNVLGISPALMMIVLGLVLGSAFFVWTRGRGTDKKKTTLVALEVIASPQELAALQAMFVVVAMEASVFFTVPLYIQIVQGRDAFQTALAMMPLNLAVFFTAFLVVRLFNRFAPRKIAGYAFALVAAAALWLAFVVHNDWSTFPVMLGLVAYGTGQGALMTLLFNVLVSASPKELAGDVGAVRSTANNLGFAIGTAFMGALVVGVLSATVMRSVTENPVLRAELTEQLDIDSINFLSNDRLAERLKSTTASSTEIDEAMRINQEARLHALRTAFFVLGSLALLAIFPSSRLADYSPEEMPAVLPTKDKNGSA
jgi:predicted MFS family arabinose efflux permease